MAFNSAVGWPELMNCVHLVERETQLRELLLALRGGRAFEFVNGLIELVSLRVIVAARGEIILPRVAAAEADDEILGGQPKRAQRINQQRDQFRVRRRGRFRR